MLRKRNKTGKKTHDVVAEWTDDSGRQQREHVGIRSVTNTGDFVEVFFKSFPVEIATITATPIERQQPGTKEVGEVNEG